MADSVSRIKRHDNSFKALSKGARTSIVLLSMLLLAINVAFPILLNIYSVDTIKLSRSYKEGELSDETIYSPIDFSYIDTVATEELLKEASSKIPPQFTYSISESIIARNIVDEFLNLFSSNPTMTAEEFLSLNVLVDDMNVIGRIRVHSASESQILAHLIEECTVKLINAGLLKESDILRVIEEGWTRISIETSNDSFEITESEVGIEEVVTRSNLPQFVLAWVTSVYPNISGADIDLISCGVELLARENVFYDDIYTKSLIKRAEDSVSPVLVEIKEGDELLSLDKIVTSSALRTINAINSKAIARINPYKLAGEIFYIAAIIVLFLIYLIRSIQYKYRVVQYTIIVLLSAIVVYIVNFFLLSSILETGISTIDPFIPYIILPLLATVITSNKVTGIITGIVFASLLAIWPTSTIFSFFYIVTCAVLCIYFINFNNNRFKVITQCLINASAVAFVTFIFSLLYQMPWISVLISIAGAIVNVIAAHVVLSILLPVLESIFNIPTGYRLHELSYTDTPILNRLNQVALGTYNHVKNVSDMAYTAAKAIGVNAELARVGALYHDIGKVEHPEYFVENQTGKNIHDDISLTLSAAIIKSHVRLGVEKAKEIGLPQEVIDIIGEHHGNDLIKYFYNEAVKNNKFNSAVSEEDFRYSGDIPSTPESGIVMLADCVEAATRTIKNPTHQKYDKFISNIISEKINYNQLDNSQLTITDLKIIKDLFIHQLMGRDHHRIKYDNDK